jgi:hypothetical protein
MIGSGEIAELTGGRIGTFDVPCPLCGPLRHSPTNRSRPVLRVWQVEPAFATYFCARCGEKGYARDDFAPKLDPAKVARARQEAAQCERHAAAERLRKALWLWSQRELIAGSPAEGYLREARGYHGVLPATLGFLPERGDYPAAVIAAFGVAVELEPGVIAINESAVHGVHLTRLRADGSAKAGTDTDKIMIGFRSVPRSYWRRSTIFAASRSPKVLRMPCLRTKQPASGHGLQDVPLV